MAIKITPSGIVEYDTKRDGQRWRTTIMPGDTTRATELLSADELQEVKAAWTPTILSTWAAQMAANEAERAEQAKRPQQPSIVDRLAALEIEVEKLKGKAVRP